MQRQAQHLRRILNLRGHGDVGLGRRRIARRVVVHEDQRAGVQFQRALDHLARIDRHVIDRAARLFLVRDQHILAVKEQDAELFGFAVRHGGVAIVEQRIPGGQDRAVHHPRAGHALCDGLDQLQFLHHGLAHARDRGKPRGRCA